MRFALCEVLYGLRLATCALQKEAGGQVLKYKISDLSAIRDQSVNLEIINQCRP
jgi:hypothetical protein